MIHTVYGFETAAYDPAMVPVVESSCAMIHTVYGFETANKEKEENAKPGEELRNDSYRLRF